MSEQKREQKPVIYTENLSKRYGEFHALSGVNLSVPRHSITGFLGPNGAGKSTTIKLLLGLRRPTSGRASIFGLDIVAQSTEIRQRSGYLAQSPRFYPNLTARETLQFVAGFFYEDHHLEDRHLVEQLVDESLELVGLQHKAKALVRGFSGGELQRLGIAQAQINRPELLILDEPAAALDPMGREQVLSIMERLRQQSTIFYSTHILDDVQRVSDRVAILNRGQLVAQGPIEELLAGDGGIVYRLSLDGDVSAAYERVSQQSWVTGISARQQNSTAHWQVTVDDEAAARSQLLRLVLAGNQADVLSFERAQYELEDVFMKLVQEQ